jgi:phosphopantetheinyl transferase (holo-ACP synthase)
VSSDPPLIVRIGAYSLDPNRFAEIVRTHPGAAAALGLDAGLRTIAEQAAGWAVKQAVLRALGAPIRLCTRWADMQVSRDESGAWSVTSRSLIRQFYESHTLGHIDLTVREEQGMVIAYAVLTRDADR